MKSDNDFVDLSDIPKYKRKNDWKNAIGKSIKGRFEDVEYIFFILDYDKNNQKITIKYNNDIYTIQTRSLLSNNVKCIIFPKKRFPYAEYKYEIGSIVNNMKTIDRRRIERLSHPKNKKERTIKEKEYRRKCMTCGYDNNEYGWTKESLMNNNVGCPVCCGQKVVEGINDIPTTAPWMVDYFQGGYEEAKQYTCTSGKKIRPICPECGRIKDIKLPIFDIHRRNSIGCICGDGYSYPEKFVYSMLSQLKIEFVYQLNKKQLRWCDIYKYDFYIPQFNVIIETHGKQHYDKDFFKSYKIQQDIDKEKKELALKNGIKNYIELDCRNSELYHMKKSIKESLLSNLFSMDVVDFNKCHSFAISNIAKEVCNIKNNHPDYTTFQIADMFNISVNTIQRYLKNGNLLGWCKYDTKDESKRAHLKSGKTQREIQRAIVVRDEKQNILGVFVNAHRLSDLSEKIFGVKLLPSNILESCRNDSKKSVYKKMTFDFVDDYILL